MTKLLPEHLGLASQQQRERVEGFFAHLPLQLEQPALRDVIVVDDPGPAAVLLNLNPGAEADLALQDLDALGFAYCVLATCTVVGRNLCNVRWLVPKSSHIYRESTRTLAKPSPAEGAAAET